MRPRRQVEEKSGVCARLNFWQVWVKTLARVGRDSAVVRAAENLHVMGVRGVVCRRTVRGSWRRGEGGGGGGEL